MFFLLWTTFKISPYYSHCYSTIEKRMLKIRQANITQKIRWIRDLKKIILTRFQLTDLVPKHWFCYWLIRKKLWFFIARWALNFFKDGVIEPSLLYAKMRVLICYLPQWSREGVETKCISDQICWKGADHQWCTWVGPVGRTEYKNQSLCRFGTLAINKPITFCIVRSIHTGIRERQYFKRY
jgi:hypothetical protein